ncbi:MAG: hypothetical protein IJE51_05630 [Clostridia bacterium]|nr:hypothetical protein [Clostridia bacterium]
MSIVRYTNKKTGQVALYESTSYYDPETKQSRPRRKYLGIEDPETGKLIPSSGKRGRKKAQEGNMPAKKISREDKYKVKYEKLLKDFSEKEARIKQLEHENKKLKFSIAKLRDAASEILEGNVTS